jgi:hypothetical protein
LAAARKSCLPQAAKADIRQSLLANAERTMPEPVEKESPEMLFRRGYEHGVIDTFGAIEQFLDAATRDVLRAWIEKDVYVWRTKAMLGYPPIWRLKMLAGRGSRHPLGALSAATGRRPSYGGRDSG